jgi:signal transduction histidine kinase
MNRNQALKHLCMIAALCILVGIAIGLLSAQITASREYRSAAKILGFASHTEPGMEETLVRALKEGGAADFEAGDAILQKYGYSPGVFENRSVLPLMGSGVLLMLVLAVPLAVTGYYTMKRRQARIAGLTAYLESANLGRDTQLIRQEDDFSRLEDELYKTVTALRQSSQAASRERQSLADNLADISHQLKTPITSMSLMTQLLSESRTDEQAIYIEKLDRQLHRLEALVSSLLTLSKLDAGTLEVKRESVEVFAMLTLAAEPVEDMLLQKKQRLIISSEAHASFTGDLAWTAEAFLNLIKNCCEHTPDGGIISIGYSQNPLYTEIVMEDSGQGFDRNDLPRLFERFYKGKNSAKDSVGIGLALSKSIIEKQNGTIRAENSPEGGARFIVKFYA